METKKGLIALVASASIGLSGCVSDGDMNSVAWLTNPYTPPGHEGYMMHKPLIFGSANYEGSQQGPAARGISWRVYVANIDMRPQTHSEDFKILAKDNLEIHFAVHARIKPHDGSVKDIIEKFSDEWYTRIVQEPFRTYVRDSVKDYTSWQANENREKMAAYIAHELNVLLKGGTFDVQQVVVGNIQYPDLVKQQIEQKLAKQQELERKDTEIEIAKKEALKRIAEADGTRKVQDMINATLTPSYLQYKAIEAYKELLDSQNPNKTIVLVPMSPNGMGLPLVLSPDSLKK